MNDRKAIRRTITLGAAALAAGALLLVAFAWTFDVLASRDAAHRYPAPGELLEVDGVTIHALCVGAGDPTLVLMHGFGGGAGDWSPLMDEMAATHRLCAFDRPGSDHSGAIPEGAWGFDDTLDVLHRAGEAMGISRPVVVGHSLGGALAQLYAARYPTRALVLVDGLSADVADAVTSRMASYGGLAVPARLGLLRPVASSFVSSAYTGPLRDRLLALRARSSAISSVAREGRMAGEELGSSRLRAAESDRTAPLLIIAAEETDVPEGELFTRSSEALAARHADGTYVLVSGAAHDVIATHAAELAAIIRDWLLDVGP